MRIYRIEDSAGYGAYRHNSSYKFEDDTRHPGPRRDSLLRPAWESLYLAGAHHPYIFGFRDMAQLRYWFHLNEWLEELYTDGFAVTVYEVPDDCVHIGYTQAIFLKEAAELVHRFTLAEVCHEPSTDSTGA